MNKRFLVAILLSILTVYGFQYFWSKKSADSGETGVVNLGQAVVPGQPIKVPSAQDLYRPLSLDVSFDNDKLTEAESTVYVQTKYYKAAFSNYGAVMTSIDFFEHTSRNGTPLRTVQSKGLEDEARKKGCFLLAFEGKTPFIYKFVQQLEKQDPKNVAAKVTELVYAAENDEWKVTKIYGLHDDSYQIDLTVAVEPKAAVVNENEEIKKQEKVERLRLFFVSPFIGELADDEVSPITWNESKNQIDKVQADSVIGNVWYWTASNVIFGAEDRYFVHTLINDTNKFAQRAYFKKDAKIAGQKLDSKTLMPVLEGPSLKDKQQWAMSFYVGPKVVDQLAFVDERLTDLMSFGWLSWICKLLLQLLDYLFGFLHNYGLAIILLTFLLRLPFTPLSIYARRKMEEYQMYQPAINKIRLKFKNDAQMMHTEIMKFHKDHNISPATQMVGCLPLLIQMPILFGLYRVLNSSLDLYQAPFFGWLMDLSSKDPYYITPVLMGLTMLWQQKMQPVGDEKQRVMMIFMSVVMTVVFINFPAGLVLYWLVNNLLTIGEDYLRKLIFR